MVVHTFNILSIAITDAAILTFQLDHAYLLDAIVMLSESLINIGPNYDSYVQSPTSFNCCSPYPQYWSGGNLIVDCITNVSKAIH